MSYLKKIEYEIVLDKSFKVVRNCAGCGMKTNYINTKRFRVNANGSKLDVWLIYQCEKCKHTYNLAIYERQKVSSIPKEEYELFQCNDEKLADEYGRKVQFFKRNKAEIDTDNIEYQFIKLSEDFDESSEKSQEFIIIHNPYELKLRLEKQVADVLDISRSNVKKLIENGSIRIETNSSQFISIYFDRENV